jgi:oxygen-independent coproporphyrinogen-3 oxidase
MLSPQAAGHVPTTDTGAMVSSLQFDAGLVESFDRPGPRYTSYPTADRFDAAFDEAAYRRAAASRDAGAGRRPLALYVHLPFCRDVCFYCACNRIVTRDARKASDYLEYLELETAMAGALFGKDPRVARMHWGGGTPTYYDAERLRALFARIARRFELAHDGEYSIEVDPRTVDGEAIEALRAIGFNRLSLGVQDFDPAVQAAVHRVQSTERTLAAIDAARRCRFDSINIDLIYGLPLQTPASFGRTLDLVVAARPGRIALYNYAHLPARFKAQRRIRAEDLPPAKARLEILGLAVERLGAAGYQYIGMDHFALPGDALAVAQRHGRLRRDFQGYSSGSPCDLVGLGVSAIGAVGATYSQNHRELENYYDCLRRGSLPVARGLQLTADDLVRRSVIEGLMCNFALSKAAIEIAYLLEFDRYFAPELEALREFEDLGLVSSRGDWITVAPKGRFLIRGICMAFDRYLRGAGEGGPRFSRVI